jgi:SNF2 family DNA or RNA helicase
MISKETYDLLKRVRASKTVSRQPTPRLRTAMPGSEAEIRLRYYQVQGVFHLITLKRLVLGDDTGIGKTLQSIAAMCYISQMEPGSKFLVVCPKSACRQWVDEIEKFSTGWNVSLMLGDSEERTRALNAWGKNEGGILITNYALLVRDREAIKAQLPKSGLVVFYDECAVFRNGKGKTYETGSEISLIANRCYGLTATPLTSELLNGFYIYKVIVPGLFKTKTEFISSYCQTKLKTFGFLKIREIVGYKNLDQFRARIDPVFLGRSKYDVASELPRLVTKKIVFDLSLKEELAYAQALGGVVEMAGGKTIEYTAAIAALSYCQQIVDGLMDEAVSSKEQEFLDLMTGELDRARVIVYTRSVAVVKRLSALLAKSEIRSVSITGEVSEQGRQESQKKFLDTDSPERVILITDAAATALNLQSAGALIFYDSPWTWGNYVQIVGRPIRIGSVHEVVVVYHLVAERPHKTKKDRLTIDGHTLDILSREKRVIEAVLGERAQGALEFEASGVEALVRAMAR